MKPTFFSLLLVASTVGFLTNCKKEQTLADAHVQMAAAGNDASNSSSPDDITKPQFEIDKNFQEQLADVFKSYVELKDAFVTSNPESVKDKARNTTQTLRQVEMKRLTGAAHNDWMTYSTSIQKSLIEIQAGADIEAQRKSFGVLSENLYKSIKAFGLAGEDAYYEYCPMAFNNEGGYWLSNEDKIRNPYFGNKMLTCGEVVEKLQ